MNRGVMMRHLPVLFSESRPDDVVPSTSKNGGIRLGHSSFADRASRVVCAVHVARCAAFQNAEEDKRD